LKFKLAHKRADKETWSASTRAQRKKTVQILRQVADELEQQMAEEEKKVTPFRGEKKITPQTRAGRGVSAVAAHCDNSAAVDKRLVKHPKYDQAAFEVDGGR